MFREDAIKVLLESREALSPDQIFARAMKMRLIDSIGKTPRNTLVSIIYREIFRHGKDADFIKTDRGLYNLNLRKFKKPKK